MGDLLVALHAELRERASEGAIRASGIAADVTLTDPDSGETKDAVQLELDHAETEAVDVYVPYTTGEEGVKFGELVAAPGRAPVFGSTRTACPERAPAAPASVTGSFSSYGPVLLNARAQPPGAPPAAAAAPGSARAPRSRHRRRARTAPRTSARDPAGRSSATRRRSA